jgi:hypothetical protein
MRAENLGRDTSLPFKYCLLRSHVRTGRAKVQTARRRRWAAAPPWTYRAQLALIVLSRVLRRHAQEARSNEVVRNRFLGRFDLLTCPLADLYGRKRCVSVHLAGHLEPAAGRDEALALVKQFNDQLRQDFWELLEEEKFAGRPRFSYRRLQVNGHRAVSRGRTVADALNAGWMQKEIERLENGIEHDPALAIGTAKELVESCCKSILGKRGIEYPRGADIGDLTKLLTKELRLVPENITDESKGAENIRLILRNLTQLTHNLAQLRGLYGSGHGRDGKHRGLQARHARLAVASAAAFIDFICETYYERIENN